MDSSICHSVNREWGVVYDFIHTHHNVIIRSLLSAADMPEKKLDFLIANYRLKNKKYNTVDLLFLCMDSVLLLFIVICLLLSGIFLGLHDEEYCEKNHFTISWMYYYSVLINYVFAQNRRVKINSLLFL